jgi:hypothetical protein
METQPVAYGTGASQVLAPHLESTMVMKTYPHIRVHLDLWHPVPPMKGGYDHGKFTVRRHIAQGLGDGEGTGWWRVGAEFEGVVKVRRGMMRIARGGQ